MGSRATVIAALLATVVSTTAACGRAPGKAITTQPEQTHPLGAGDRILPLFPDGAQVIVELDLARLRANPVVGALVVTALTGAGMPALPGDVPMSPLAKADAVVLASYGVGTSQAAMVTVIATTEQLPGATRLGDDLYALGPTEWIAQLEARAALAGISGAGTPTSAPPIVASPELLALRDHAMPPNAPGAALRITARLSFDARVALARETGLDHPPAQLSIWADVVDDLAIIVDAEAVDPGDRKTKNPSAKLEAALRGMLAGLAEDPALRALGIPSSLQRAKLVARGTWVRTIVAIGPAHLQRVVERANAYLLGKS
jgi:hypothetical protein